MRGAEPNAPLELEGNTMTQTRNIYSRLIDAQKEFSPIAQALKATAFGNGRGYNYANISDCLEKILPILNKHGLAIIQKTTTDQDRVGIETVLLSESGESISSGVFYVTTAGLTQKGVQAFGSAVTYARRYSFVSFLGLSYGDEDDDGREASRDAYKEYRQPKPRPAPAPQPTPIDMDALAARAKGAALDGLEQYKNFFKSLSNAEKAALKESGLHEQLKHGAEATAEETAAEVA